MPINYKDYPANWDDLRLYVLARAEGRCEGSPEYPDCRAENYQPHPVTGSRVVLTVAHMDHNIENNDPANLRALCQRCHNKHDAPQRAESRRKRKEARQEGLTKETVISKVSTLRSRQVKAENTELIIKLQQMEDERGRLFSIIKELQADVERLERQRGTP